MRQLANKRLAAAVLFALFLSFLTAVILLNSFPIALCLNGFQQPNTLYCGIDNNGDEYRVVWDNTSDDMKLGYFVKNRVGLWNTEQLEEYGSPEKEVLIQAWTVTTGLRKFSGDPVHEWEWHEVYCGRNAVKEIGDFLTAYLPPNTTVSVIQSESNYSIHLVYHGEAEAGFSGVQVYALLKDNGFVQ